MGGPRPSNLLGCSAYARAVTEAELARCLSALAADAIRVWKPKLRREGESWPGAAVHVVPPGGTVESPCGLAGNARPAGLGEQGSPAFFCPLDNGVYLDTSWLYETMWTVHLDMAGQLRVGGDLAVAYVVAHEVAHAVQFHRDKSFAGMASELQADCFAGIYFDDKYRSGELETAQIGAVIDATAQVGDREPNDNDHGTSVERTHAFRAGYRGGAIETCPPNVAAEDNDEELDQ